VSKYGDEDTFADDVNNFQLEDFTITVQGVKVEPGESDRLPGERAIYRGMKDGEVFVEFIPKEVCPFCGGRLAVKGGQTYCVGKEGY
jgi:hypothetical protein